MSEPLMLNVDSFIFSCHVQRSLVEPRHETTWVLNQVRLKPASSATVTSSSLEILDLACICIILSKQRTTDADQIARMLRLICAFVVRIWQNQVFS